MKRTGAQILWECLVREGVTDIFGYPGGAILPAYDAMLEEIRQAKHHVHMQFFIVRADESGQRFMSALADKARELCGSPEPFGAIDDFSGGQWRRHAFGSCISPSQARMCASSAYRSPLVLVLRA